jgi:uncharacterized protein (TIGR00369 family)
MASANDDVRKPPDGDNHSGEYLCMDLDHDACYRAIELRDARFDGRFFTAETLGYDIVEVSNGRAAIVAEPNGAHLNPAGTVHGGLSATLLDSCMGLAVHSTLDKGFGQTTLEFKISLVRAITPETGLVRAEGSVISRGRRISTAEGRLTDIEGRILAHGTTTCLIFEY